MPVFSILRKFYQKHINIIWLNKLIYILLDIETKLWCWFKNYSFPSNYIREWKWDMLLQRYEKDTVALLKKIVKPGMIVIDIGAHLGYFTRILSKLVGTNGLVYAFEADPENIKLLKNNIKKFRNIRIIQKAVASQEELVNFYHSQKTGCSSLTPSDFRQTKITVATVDIDSFLIDENIKKIDLVKLDIEGGELAALTGMEKVLFRKPAPAVIFEFNPECLKLAKIEPQKLLEKILRLGYEISYITPNGLIKADLYKTIDYQKIPLYPNFVNIYCNK